MDSIKCTGEYHFEWLDGSGRVVVYKNVITQLFFNGVFAALNGGTHDIAVTDMATGTGTTAAMKADTALQAQVFSKAISSKSVSATKFTAKLLLGTGESNVTIREIGVFAGSTLISRCNVNIEKTAGLQLLVTYTLTME